MGSLATAEVGMAQSMPVSMMMEVQEETTSPVYNESTKTINRLRDLKTSARDQLMIDPRIIIIDDGHNPRNYDLPENHAHLDALKRSIRENGTLVPMLVRYDAARKAAVLVDGECRLRANLELIAEGIEILTVPTIQVPSGNESDRLLVAITANTGKPLSKWELGAAFQRLYKFGWSEEQISTKTGYPSRFVSEAMELSDAPDEVKKLLSSQAVSPAFALSELRANGAAAVETLKAAAQTAQASGQKTAKRAKAPSTSNLNASKPQAAAPAAQVANIPIGLVTAILALIADIPAEDLNDPDEGAEVVVNVKRLLKVASYAFTEDEIKAEVGSVAF